MTKEQFLEHCGWSEEEFDHIMHLLGQGYYRYVLSVTDRYTCYWINYLEDVKEHKGKIERTAITWKDIECEFEHANEMGAGLPEMDEQTKVEFRAYEKVKGRLCSILGYDNQQAYRKAIDFLCNVNAKGVSWVDISKDVPQHLMPFLETQEDS